MGSNPSILEALSTYSSIDPKNSALNAVHTEAQVLDQGFTKVNPPFFRMFESITSYAYSMCFSMVQNRIDFPNKCHNL